MPKTTETLNAGFRIEPSQLIVARKPIPFFEGEGYIPLMIVGREFQKVEPVFTALGERAVMMSMGQPFGFIYSSMGQQSMLEVTQQTEELTLKPHPEEDNRWLATFETPKPLTKDDLGIFSYGLSFYAQSVEKQLKKQA